MVSALLGSTRGLSPNFIIQLFLIVITLLNTKAHSQEDVIIIGDKYLPTQKMEGIGYGAHFWFNVFDGVPGTAELVLGEGHNYSDFTAETSQATVVRLRVDDPNITGTLNFAIRARAANPHVKFIAAIVRHDDGEGLIDEVLEPDPLFGEGMTWKGKACGPNKNESCRDYFVKKFSEHIKKQLQIFQSFGVEFFAITLIEPNCALLAAPPQADLLGCADGKEGKIYLTPYMAQKLMLGLKAELVGTFPKLKISFPTAISVYNSQEYISRAFVDYGYEDFDYASTNHFSLDPSAWTAFRNFVDGIWGVNTKKFVCNACGDLSKQFKPNMASGIELYDNFYEAVNAGSVIWNYVFGYRPDDGASGLLGIEYSKTIPNQPVGYSIPKRFDVYRILAGIIPPGSIRAKVTFADQNLKALAFRVPKVRLGAGENNMFQELKDFSVVISNQSATETKEVLIKHSLGNQAVWVMAVDALGYQAKYRPNAKQSISVSIPPKSVAGITSMEILSQNYKTDISVK